ncbi:cholinesterase [Crassisporium funariophilum]|nr:cholinesterase [Crassisporium funariophilum]
MLSLAALGISLLHVLRQATAVPSPSSAGSDLTFLFQNDLNWPTAAEHNATILVDSPGTNAQAIKSCKVFNENLLTTGGVHFQSDITSLMRYLAFSTSSIPGQRYWVSPDATSSLSTPSACKAISLQDGIQPVSCDTQLPTFCSQSAPYRQNTETDSSAQFQVQVQTKKLNIIGTRDHLSFRFIGIPYADPFQRFSYSKKFSGSGTISALAYGSPCTQSGFGSEDCLFLNIYTPLLPRDSAKSKSLKPVLFWIHGGGFTGGEGSDSIFDGGNMVSRSDVVVVTINYRLGTLGFLALEDGVTNGNFGIADQASFQITALQWVHDHIADFGGDPSRVTIYGQSAGAGSVRALLAAKPAFGLFKGAIAQSNLGGFGYASTYSEYLTIQQEYSSFGAPLVASVGCANSTAILDCLRSLPAQTLITAPNTPRYIVVDGKIITSDHLEVNGVGPAANAHVVFGWMRDDGADFIGSFPNARSSLSQSLLAAGVTSDVTSKVLTNPNIFPMPTGPNSTLNLFNLTSRVGTDGQFLCVDHATLVSAAKHKVFPSVYAYQFDRSYAGYEPISGTCDPPATAAFPNGDPNLPYFRCHSGELYYVFGNLGQDMKAFRDWDDLVLSQVVVDMWASFARTFNPNPAKEYLDARGYSNTTGALQQGGLWTQVTPSNQTPLRIIDVPLVNSAWRENAQCDLLGYPATMFE